MSDSEAHISVTALAKLLGIHRNTAMKLIRAGKFPNAIRVGRVWRVSRSDLSAFTTRNRLTAKAG